MQDVDVIVVGGGPAGLAGALTLGRAMRQTLLLDSGEYRNAPAAAVRNFFTRDGTPPAELRRIGREQLEPYPSVGVRQGTVEGATAADGWFHLSLAGGETVRGRRLLLATGVIDDLPPIDGLAAVWGRSVFRCPYCHGYEVRDTPLAVLGAGPAVEHLALHLTRFSRDVALCTNGGPAPAAPTLATFERHGVVLRPEPVARFEAGASGDLERIVFESGPALTRHAVFLGGAVRQRSRLPEWLGCARFEDEAVAVDELGLTSVPGVYAAGDMARRASMPAPFAAVVAAAAGGTIAAAAIDRELLASDLAAAAPALVGGR